MTAPVYPPFDRLVRKEVALGVIREMLPPTEHIGLAQIAPFKEVGADDVIFDYIKGGLSDGLAPARAEDAESELAQKDEGSYAQGRASVIDWSLKDKYTASDVSAYRDAMLIQAQLEGLSTLNLSQNMVANFTQDFDARVARHDALRRRKLDNRLEWLIMSGLEQGKLQYDDGKIAFSVNYGRPTAQQNVAPNALPNRSGSVLWDDAGLNADPIGDLLAAQQFMWTNYNVVMNRAIISRRIVTTIWQSKRFIPAFIGGLGQNGTPIATASDPNYMIRDWSPSKALALVSEATGIEFTVYDSVWRTRPIGGTAFSNNRFTDDSNVILLPDPDMMAAIDETDIGFAKTLTSPHPEGNWTPGYYEWEQTKLHDPWLTERGAGIKAFPVFPFLEYSMVMKVLAQL